MPSAALWMLMGAGWLALMALGVKIASSSYGTLELVFYRGFVGLLVVSVVARVRRTPLRTPVPRMHVGRSLAGVASIMAWFYALGHLPLPTATTLNYTSGLWLSALVLSGGWLYGRPQPQLGLLAAVLLGFVGVLMILRPTLEREQLFAGMIGLLSGLCAAMAYLQIAAMGKVGEPEDRMVFYFSLSTAAAGLVSMGVTLTPFTSWAAVPWQHTAWLVSAGGFASLVQWCLSRAYRDGPSLLVACMQYVGIVFATLLGALWFDDDIAPMSWAGIAVIVLGGVFATTLRARTLRDAAAKEH